MVALYGKGMRIPFLSAISLLLLILASSPVRSTPEFREEPLVNSWAQEFGEKLYEISQSVTRAEKIEAQYRKLNATVEAKDGRKLLDQIVDRIGDMLQRKADAVKCIVERVEELAERLGDNNNHTAPHRNGEEQASPELEVDEREKESGGEGSGEDGGEEEDDDEEDEDEILIEFSYHSAKCSQVEVVVDEDQEDNNGSLYSEEDNSTCENDGIYRPMRLKADRHFYNIPVNANHSAVHVPTNVYDQARYMLEWIDMSEGLDEVFVKNYQNDPSLSWQYFGSFVGYLRHFPAMRWKSDPDLFDCRGRPWYVEAASACTKSAVVLVDLSGSMTGMRFSIARLTIGSLLETFAPNDLVNVVTFSEHPEALVPCFKDTLVPATRENILAFKSALSDVQGLTEGYANFTAAFAKAFELLELNRASRSDCSTCKPYDNEVLFLVTDNVPGNWSTFFKTYNSPLAQKLKMSEVHNNESNSPTDITEEEKNVNSLKDKVVSDSDSVPTTTSSPTRTSDDILPPVRIVAYLLGKEVFNLKEIEKFTCENRGFSVNLQSLDEVKEEVLEYVPLLATPLALLSAEGYPRPIIWTHTFADVAEDDESMGYVYQEYRLMTSVSSPAFLRRIVNATNDTEVVADLLGVAGTDVPIDEFKELLHAYEIGVNGYGFAVTTEGNILFHPGLRPVFQGSLKDGFNSVDLTEIELVDEEKGPREFSEEVLKLREGMVKQEEGEALGIEVLMPHDDMKRLTSESRNYYYAPLVGTPYTLALSLPAAYGLYKIGLGAEDQIKRFREKGLDDYFHDENWKVHREWLYCKYLSETFQLFNSPEERLIHFLKKIGQPDWRWTNADPQVIEPNPNTHCRHTAMAKDVYKCDKSLIELLLFDARLTNNFFKTKQWELNNEEEKELFHLFNVTLRFIATHSGLTRWQEGSADNENATSIQFAEYFSQAIDESWYKKSVIWYQADPGSYVYTMRYPREGEDSFEDGNEDLTQVTATRAIYLHNVDKATPASVVGYQFPQSVLQDLLIKITSDYYCSKEDSKAVCNDRQSILKNGEKLSNYSAENKLFSSSSLLHSCTSGEVTCYLLDGSGYILAVTSPENSSESASAHKSTGRFFGEIEAEVMSQLVDVGLYIRRPLFDYQAICIQEFITSRASILLLPFYSIQWVFQWAIGQIIWLLLKTNLHTILLPQWTHAAIDSYYDYDEPVLVVPFGESTEEEEKEVLRDWRGRSIGKDDDYHPKKVVTIVKEACDKWAYRFSLTPPPPPPTTEMPTTTETPTTDETPATSEMPTSTSPYDDSDDFDEETTASDYSESSTEWTTQPTNSASMLYPFSTVKSVVNRWKRGISSSSPAPPVDQFNDNHSSTTEDYEASTKMNVSEEMDNQTHCSRPFTAERIPHSDLVLVVITNSDSYLLCAEARKANEDLDIHEESDDEKDDEDDVDEIWEPSRLDMHVELKTLTYNDTHACHKLRTGKLPRGKKVSNCVTQHPKEQLNLLLCSGCKKLTLNAILTVLSFTVILMNS